jgi:peptidyl-prolyl cis-trans isomerase C
MMKKKSMKIYLFMVAGMLALLQACTSEDSVEYKARHILVATSTEAEAIIDRLEQGEDFAELAKQESTGPSGPRGGDLGWFSASMMVPPFAQEVRSLEVGKFSRKPVQTRFGWHVVLVEEMR